MDKLIRLSGYITALLGIVICLLAGIARVVGNYHVLGYESMTLFTAGIALMVAACLAKLYQPDLR